MDEKPLSTLGSGDQGPLQLLEATSRRAHRAQPAHRRGAPGPGPAWARKEQKAEGPGVQEAASSPPQPSCLGFLLLSLLTLGGGGSPGLLCERGRKGKLGRAGRAAALQINGRKGKFLAVKRSHSSSSYERLLDSSMSMCCGDLPEVEATWKPGAQLRGPLLSCTAQLWDVKSGGQAAFEAGAGLSSIRQ
uniref:Uncharacterized protein n=1 Tax=Rangifer tarandus platyrhynchus TaxID=3082113 RepID=A0ACB0EYA5_RANTA|nr:unnamed protein product [Rangifer tarandus platyrhynchus]